MKMWKIDWRVLLGVIVAAGLAGGQANAQDSSHKSEGTNEELMHQVAEDVKQAQRSAQDAAKAAQEELARAGDVQVHINTPNLFFGNPMADKIRQAAEELRDAKDDDAREKANGKLRDLLDKYFEDDMTRRQKELESVESRLQKLRAQLDRRRAKKQEIIDLQVKMSTNEADGLGFYSQPGFEPLELHPILQPRGMYGPVYQNPAPAQGSGSAAWQEVPSVPPTLTTPPGPPVPVTVPYTAPVTAPAPR